MSERATARMWWRKHKKLLAHEKKIQKICKRYFLNERRLVLAALRESILELQAAARVYRPIKTNVRAPRVYKSITVNIRALKNVQKKAGKKFEKDLKVGFQATARSAGADAAVALGFKFPGYSPGTSKFIKEHVPKISGQIAETTRKRIMTQIKQGVEKGEPLSKIAARVSKLYKGFSEARALRIAKHETGAIAAVAEDDTLRGLPIDNKKIKRAWRTARDPQVRDLHQIEGEVRSVGRRFSNGLMFPRDPEGDIKNTANCRCFLEVYVID